MKWSEALTFPEPLRGLRLVSCGGPEMEERARQREAAAYQRGLAAGEMALGEQLMRQRAELSELQNGVLAALQQASAQVVRESETALIELAYQVALKLVDDLPISAEMVEAGVRGALAQVDEATEFHVYLHSEDIALLQRNDSPLLKGGAEGDKIHVRPSAEVTRGGCLVHTRFGIIDGLRETKQERVRQSLSL